VHVTVLASATALAAPGAPLGEVSARASGGIIHGDAAERDGEGACGENPDRLPPGGGGAESSGQGIKVLVLHALLLLMRRRADAPRPADIPAQAGSAGSAITAQAIRSSVCAPDG